LSSQACCKCCGQPRAEADPCRRRVAAPRAPRPGPCQARRFPRDLHVRQLSRARLFPHDLRVQLPGWARHCQRGPSSRPQDDQGRSPLRRGWMPHRGRHLPHLPRHSSPALHVLGLHPCLPHLVAAMAWSRRHRLPCTAALSARPGGGHRWAHQPRVRMHPHDADQRRHIVASWVHHPRRRIAPMRVPTLTMAVMMAVLTWMAISCMAPTSMRWKS